MSRRLRDWLVVSEVAVALALLLASGLLLQALTRLQQLDAGVDTRNALTFRVELGWAAYGTREKTTSSAASLMTRRCAVRSASSRT